MLARMSQNCEITFIIHTVYAVVKKNKSYSSTTDFLFMAKGLNNMLMNAAGLEANFFMPEKDHSFEC